MAKTQTLSTDRGQVLARVEAALGDAIARLDERANALASATSFPQSPLALDFSLFDDKLASFASRPQRIGQQLKELDGALGNGEDALRQWLARAETTRRQLATWTGRAVG